MRGRRVVGVAVCLLAVGCGGGTTHDQAPSATVAAGRTSTPPSTTATTAATSPTTDTAPPAGTVEEEVEAAYLRSWDVYTDAMLRLDPSRLHEVYAGDALAVRQHEIATAPHPARMRVEHDYEIAVVNAETALVFETYVNHSVYLDAVTMQPVEPDPNDVLKREYVLHEEPAGWRVTQVNAGS